jgi:hypothetical protein
MRSTRSVIAEDKSRFTHGAICHALYDRSLAEARRLVVEASGGPEHYRPFADYIAAGGIGGILADSRVGASGARRSVFWHGCREMVVLDGQAKVGES